MPIIAIKGVQTKERSTPTETIRILEMLGGKNVYNFKGKEEDEYYYIKPGTLNIRCGISSITDEVFDKYSVEEFNKKFQFKVNDIVLWDNCEMTVVKMSWDSFLCDVIYFIEHNDGERVHLHQVASKELLPCKKNCNMNNTLKQIKEYFDKTPIDFIEKEWSEYNKLNNISTHINEYLDFVKKNRVPEYPKTYFECCSVLGNNTQNGCYGHKSSVFNDFMQLIVCRDAYLKLYSEENDIKEPWKPDWKDNNQQKWTICFYQDEIQLTKGPNVQRVLAFPNEVMRDTFFKHFKTLIYFCKELL
jgi:hypothetical protein